MKTCSWASRQVAIRIETSKDEDTPDPPVPGKRRVLRQTDIQNQTAGDEDTPDLPMSSGSTRLAEDFTGLDVFEMLTNGNIIAIQQDHYTIRVVPLLRRQLNKYYVLIDEKDGIVRALQTTLSLKTGRTMRKARTTMTRRGVRTRKAITENLRRPSITTILTTWIRNLSRRLRSLKQMKMRRWYRSGVLQKCHRAESRFRSSWLIP